MIQPPSTQAMLVIAHPAHELRVLSWFEAAAPRLAILTTGSRSGDNRARLERTAVLAKSTGAPLSGVFGPMLDRELYGLVERGDGGPLGDCITRLGEEMARDGTQFVVVDAWQGYSIAHDLAHLVGRIAAAEAAARTGRAIEVVEFAPVSTAVAPRLDTAPALYGLSLPKAEAERKARLAADYPDVAAELAELIEQDGPEALSEERFFAPPPLRALLEPPGVKPYYERIGEERVASGVYAGVLRWRDLAPVARGLCARVAAELAA
ncbi:MAG: hypothetical protein JWP35_2465 [Caulobacter sp.]|nr:hypothetical protein [Caulobacter sp.]